MGSVSLLVLMTVTLMILYGIAGAYQPSVQASVPALVEKEHFMAANSVINTISSLASLLGPVLGGILYSAYGLKPVLWIRFPYRQFPCKNTRADAARQSAGSQRAFCIAA